MTNLEKHLGCWRPPYRSCQCFLISFPWEVSGHDLGMEEARHTWQRDLLAAHKVSRVVFPPSLKCRNSAIVGPNADTNATSEII